jgi:hypothetical protein
MTDDEEKQLRLELLAVKLSLRRKQEFWETPRNIAILVGVTAAIAAAVGFWLGRESTPPPPLAQPVFGVGSSNGMVGAQFIDAVETAGIVVIASMLVYVVVRLDRTLTAAAREIKGALAAQPGLTQAVDRTLKRLEMVEHQIRERNEILPRLGPALDEIRDRLDRLESDKRGIKGE